MVERKKSGKRKNIVLSDEVEAYLGAKKEGTARAYRSNLKRFRIFYGKSIMDFIKIIEEQRERNKEIPAGERTREYEGVLNDFIKWGLSEGYANNPIRGTLTSLQNLCKYYEVQISYSFVNVPPMISKKGNVKHRWKIKEIKEFVAGAKTYRDKAIIMVMFQSGMAVNEICELDYGDVSRGLNLGESPLLIHIVRKKNSNEFKTLLGADGIRYLKLYLGTRINLKRDSPLFTKEGSKQRITGGAIQNRFRELAGMVFGLENGEMNPYRPHSLRSAFRSRLAGKMDTDIIKFWMGDKLGAKSKAYLNLPDEEYVELYLKIEHRLSIETTSELVKEGEKSSLAVADVYVKKINQLTDDNTNLRKSVENLQVMVGDLAQKLGEFDGLKAKIEDLEDFLRTPNGPAVKEELGTLKKEIN